MRRKPIKGVERGHFKHREMPHVSGQHRQFVSRGDGGYRGIGKTRRLAAGPCLVEQPAKDSRGAHIQLQHPRAIKMQQCLEPPAEALRPYRPALPAQFGDTVLDLGHCNNADEQIVRAVP